MTSLTANTTYASYDRQIASWLIVCAGVIFGMIILGGVTRLTNSGLSMVEWRPLMGIIPPMSEAAWLEVFEKYKQYPEYQQINRGMSLDGFKYIFMYEYLHRVLGRLIGVLFFVPMVYFALKQRVKPGLMPKLWGLFILGGCQGLLGWYMVKSGLVDRPDVSQYRLTAQLGLAVLIYALMVWLILDLLYPSKAEKVHGLYRYGVVLAALVYLMILSGGLVAGTNAGFAYNTWPLLGDSFVPAGLYNFEPAWLAAFEDIATIQFNHRMFAYALVLLIGVFSLQVLLRTDSGRAKLGAALFLAALVLQVMLGISTLVMQVPVSLGAAHQGGAVVLLTAAIFAAHSLKSAR